MSNPTLPSDCACCAAGPDAVEASLREMIANTGFAMIGVMAESKEKPTFVYTVGMASKGLPELCMIGVQMMTAQSIIGAMAKHFIDGKLNLANLGHKQDAYANVPMLPKRVYPHTEDQLNHFAWVPKFVDDPEDLENIVFVQVVVPDRYGHFPGDEGYYIPSQTLLPTEPLNIPAQAAGEPRVH